MIDNKFYVARKSIFSSDNSTSIFAGYSCETGEGVQTGNMKVCAMINPISVSGYNRILFDAHYENAIGSNYYWLDKNKKLIGKELSQPQKIDCEVPNGAYYFMAEVIFSVDVDILDNVNYVLYKQVTPHYKTLKKQYKKESNQIFFRETLDGKINLFGQDYEYIKNCSIEDKLIFDIYQNGKKYITTTFNKTDCKFDHFKKSVELKLVANDAYTDILNKYENKYDIIKLAPARTWITLTKRCVVQIYIQGDKVISSYAGGTYWETDVDEAIDSADDLEKKYYFTKGTTFREINLTGFNYDINTVYSCVGTDDCWNSDERGMPCSIKFTKVYDADTTIPVDIGQNILVLSDGETSGVNMNIGPGGGNAVTKYDTYRIEIYTDNNATGQKIYQSDKLYGNDGNFTIAPGSNLYPMTKIDQPTPQKDPTPNTFNLSDYIIEYNVWARLLCDISTLSDGTATYDLPYDDFATPRANYRKCIGLIGFESESSVIKLLQKKATSDKPTSFGMNDFGKYFESPFVGYSQHTVYPLARSTWGNTSLWAVFMTDSNDSTNSFENWCAKSYKQYQIKDCFNISNIIKVLLKEISGGTVKHEPTEEYSQFLYGNGSVASSSALKQCQLYLTQKTNVLKGEYDQAAQKAEITLKQIMDMLRDCFRCYWYVDSNNRFIIEHATYFTNGFSYGSSNIGIDCTNLTDKFNKKNIQYCQHELNYDKTDLQSRFEFGWMDESTDSMSNLTVDVKNEYIQKDNIESVIPDVFSTDIDYMLFLPSDFSEDGFALIAADKNGLVPISSSWLLRDNKQDVSDKIVTPQNWVLSWNQLIQHYLYDMPGGTIEYNNLPIDSLYVFNIRKSMKHDVTIQGMNEDLDATKIVKTSFGNGYIESISSNIDTRLVTITLAYKPT